MHRKELHASSECRICHTHHVQRLNITYLPVLLAFELHRYDIYIDHHLLITVNSESATYALKGMIYYGLHHFTSCFVSQHGMVWYHDGISTGQSLINEGSLESIEDLSKHGSMVATAVIYARYVD